MAGVVAMASVIEDFDSQPCKKSRKDGGNPVVKTITNYFSPMPKPVEKPFSPPRSNNIMDYFSRKAPSSKEKSSSPEQSKENCQVAEKHTSAEAAAKLPSQKRRRKASKASRKLVEAETFSLTEDASCLIVEDPDDGASAAKAITNCGVLGSDTAALMLKLTAEACGTDEYGSKCEEDAKLSPELKCIELSPILPSKDKSKKVKTIAGNSKNTQYSEAEEKEKERSLCDVSMDVNVDEASQLNRTVTISFEDFVRSQGRDPENIEDEHCKETESNIAEEMDTDQLDIPKAEEHVGATPFQVSPRTVTIQAEVHVVSHKQEAKVGGKLASIFCRRKGEVSPAESVSSPQMEARHHLLSTSPTIKHKSNVVLQEEDLELAVLESESMPKCSEAERKQFMSAFKQPNLDGSKAKAGKSQGKLKQPGEKALDDTDKAAEEDVIPSPSVDQDTAGCHENKADKKPARRGRKKAKVENDAGTTTPVPAEESVTVEFDDKIVEPPVTSTPSIPVVRRSRREAVARQAAEAAPTTPTSPVTRNTRKHHKSKDAAAAPANDSPANRSTPKIRKSERRIFVAEMVCPPDAKQSPIRMKFTRVHKNVSMAKGDKGSGINTSVKASNETKKIRRAKKLVEKARVIQQSKTTVVKEKGSLRRSSRTETSTKKSYCEDEDSVVFVEEDQAATPQAAPEKSKTQKALRSLNEVLGKASSASKETKAVPGFRGASLGQEKTARKASAVISIFDDSGSENSQDDEQFRARREFLKSGLPESFRKQIAKTAATREAYSVSCSSFQPVIHKYQPSNDCPLWSLPWPECPLLCHLKELLCHASRSPPVSGSICVKTEAARRAFCERSSGWRSEISESVRQLLMEEVRTSNPPFPVQMFITRSLKRRADHQQQCTASAEPEAVKSTTLPSEPVGGKRKRMDDEGEAAVKMAKKQRADDVEEISCDPEPTKRGGRTRRARKTKSEEGSQPEARSAPIPSEDDCVVVIDDLPLGEIAAQRDVVKEDVLWTEKYQPQHSSDIIGNTTSVRRLHSWLKEWKLRADREERKKQKDKKQEEGSNDSDWDCGDEDSQDGEDMLCNTMLITGPTGVGKTAAVYACAQELGFKVFEVNASSQRSGRLILSQLKEATQSHQVDSQGVNAHKPTYFNSYGTSSSAGALKPGHSPRKVNSPRRVVSSPRKHPQSPRCAKRGGLAPTSLANFFKMGRPTTKETPNTKKNETATSKKVPKANERANKQKDPAVKSPTPTASQEKSNDDQNKKTATSLILFEEVDVILDEDSGFLAAIKTFMTTTKRPVILTTSDPAFSTMFDGNFEEILFKTPSVLDVSSFLRLLCLTEDVRTDQLDISSLLTINRCDIRQSLLQLQFWTRSAGGRHMTRPLAHSAEGKPQTDEETVDSSVLSSVPPCDTGCTESMLGLLNVRPEGDIWDLIRSQSSVEETLCWELLTNSKRRGVDLLYSNMETLLPLPLKLLTTSTYKPAQSVSVSVNPKELPSHARLLHTAEGEDCSDDGSPIKISKAMRKNKKQRSLPDTDGLHSDSDSDEAFLSLSKPQGAPQAREEVEERLVPEPVRRRPLTPEERAKSLPVSQCLESIADFLDNMSCMDSSLPVHSAEGGTCRTVSQVCAVKDGMTDESRVESDGGRWAREENVLEIPAAVEALSFQKCRVSVAEAWDKAQRLDGELRKEAAAELTLPVAPHHEGYSFTHYDPCQPQTVQRRREVMESLTFRGVCGTLGNRPAAALDYLPALRSICRSEQLKEQGKIKRRFLHYLDAIHLGLERSTLQHLAEGFP